MDITEALRSIIWGVMSMLLHVIDVLWSAAKLICGLDFNNSGFKFIWDLFAGIAIFFAMFLIFRIMKIIIQAFLDDEKMQKLEPGAFIVKIALAIMIMSGVPLVTKQLTGMVNTFVSHIEYFTGDKDVKDGGKLSTLLVDTSSMNLESGESTVKTMKNYILEQKQNADSSIMSKKEFKKYIKMQSATTVASYLPNTNIPGSQLTDAQINEAYSAYKKMHTQANDDKYNKTYWVTGNIDNIDINEGVEDGKLLEYFVDTVTFGLAGQVDKVYYMYPSWSSLFFGLFTTVGIAFLFIPIILQMAQREVSLLVKIFLAPYAVSALIEPGNQTFSTWTKYILADLISNFFQLYSMMILFAFIGSSTLDSVLGTTSIAGSIAKIGFVLGGLLAIYATPSGIAAIIGGADMSAANTLQQVQSLMMVGAMSGAVGAGVIGAGISGVAKGLSGAGALGGAVASGANKLSGGRLAGAAAKMGFDAGKGGSDGFGGSSGGKPINDLSPNKAQADYAKSLGINGQGMTRGEMADTVANAGGSLSAFSAMGNDVPLTGDQMDYADSLGMDANDMAQGDLNSSVSDFGGSQTVTGLLGKEGNGMTPSIGQVAYAQSLGIENAQNMSRSQLGNAVEKAGGSTIRYNRAGGMTGREAFAVSRASNMNTKNATGNFANSINNVGNFFTSKAASMQSMANFGMYGRRR